MHVPVPFSLNQQNKWEAFMGISMQPTSWMRGRLCTPPPGYCQIWPDSLIPGVPQICVPLLHMPNHRLATHVLILILMFMDCLLNFGSQLV